jgi:hypothetical protein
MIQKLTHRVDFFLAPRAPRHHASAGNGGYLNTLLAGRTAEEKAGAPCPSSNLSEDPPKF